jgi:hypothetical protein
MYDFPRLQDGVSPIVTHVDRGSLAILTTPKKGASMRTSLPFFFAVATSLAAPSALAAQASELPCVSYATFERKGSNTELIGLAIGDLPAGSKVSMACSGADCSFASRSLTIKNDVKTLGITDMIDDPNFKPGTILQIQVTKPGWIGKSFKYEIMSSEDPRATTECLAADGSKTVACRLKEASGR